MTSRLRELIQQLGEAIHESVIESEQIAGVVQDIRKHGFDVLLMLEATIGLNEVSAMPVKKGEAGESAAETSAEAGAFTQNDLHFLRSLRISVEGETRRSRDRREVSAASSGRRASTGARMPRRSPQQEHRSSENPVRICR